MKQNLYDPSLLRPADDLLIKVERRGRCARREDPEQILMIVKSVEFYLNQQTNKQINTIFLSQLIIVEISWVPILRVSKVFFFGKFPN